MTAFEAIRQLAIAAAFVLAALWMLEHYTDWRRKK